MSTTTTTTTGPASDAAEVAANFDRLRVLSKAAAVDGWQYAGEVAARNAGPGATPADLEQARDAGMWAWVRGYVVDDAQEDEPAGIAARVLGIADALDELRAAGTL